MSEKNPEVVSEHSVLNLLSILVEWRKTILVAVGISAIIGLAAAFLISRQYKSVARVLPPRDVASTLGASSSISSLVRSLPTGLAKLGKGEDTFNYLAILKSRTVMESVIRKFDLFHVYDIPDTSMEKAIRALKGNMETEWTEENTLEIRVWDDQAQRAAGMANYFVEILNQRSYELQTQEARNTRLFIEGRLNQNRTDLFDAEQALKAYQEKVGMILAVDPSNPKISALAELYVMKVKKEIELAVLKRTVGGESPEYTQSRLELETLNSRIATFPEITIESLRLLREVAIQQKIMEFVVPLYEEAKVNEHKDVPVAYVLDPGIPGERPDRPRRLFILGIAVFVGILVAVAIVSLNEYASDLKANAPRDWEQWKAMKRAFVWTRREDGYRS